MLRSSTKSPDLERQLLRRSVMALAAGRDRCDGCHRTPLIGERVHVYDGGRTLCELCRRERREQPVSSQLVHGGEHGNTVRITDQRPLRRPRAA
ncbi:hypothetical protein [Conexibacter arvalis]|uniref:Uncharacterized protein n=1 Tax=Conexibacter arvalis TaxID=912552 RepID=A0A840IEQ7_9ACTN|nr:hypothetical protein [Conexibacter arvalis]MBB4662554.1 hypothetical protein [Conexibacter arvalis]